MNKKTLLLTALIIALCTFTTSWATAPATPATPATAAQLNITEGTAHGTEAGTADGAKAGQLDQKAGLASVYSRNIPSTTTLNARYRLTFENSSYQNAFLTAYRTAYEIAYNTAFRKANISTSITPLTEASLHAIEAAKLEAHYMASLDLIRNLPNSWLRAYEEWNKKGTVETRYMLGRESIEYSTTFKEAFIDAFRSNYTNDFSDMNLEIEKQNSNYHAINMNASKIQVNRLVGEVPNGAVGMESFIPAIIDIPQGAVYQDTLVGLHSIQNTWGNNAGTMEPVTHSIRITIANQSGAVKLYKPIKLSFNYTGDERVGIYEWKYNKWIYMPTVRTLETLDMTIPEGNYSGGQYAVFIDNTYKTPKDIAFNWAFNDVITSVRRGHILSTDFFRPNDGMTRAEFADILYRTMSYRTSLPTSKPTIADASKLGAYKTQVEYVLGMRYMFLNSAQQFNPSAYMTYQDAEIALSAIFLADFKYKQVADKMLYERYQRSGYLINVKGPVKRAEIIYMMNTFVK